VINLCDMVLTWYGQGHRIETPEASNQRLTGAEMIAVQNDKTVVFGQYLGTYFQPSYAKPSKTYPTAEKAAAAVDRFNKKQK